MTWSRIAECLPSATSGVSSTPRLIGPGRQEQQVVLGELQPLLGHHVKLRVLGDRGKQPSLLPLELDPQDVDDVAPRQDLVEVIGDLAAEPLPRPGAPGSAGRTG